MWSGMVAYGHSCNNQEAKAGGSQKVGGQSSVQTNKTKKQTNKKNMVGFKRKKQQKARCGGTSLIPVLGKQRQVDLCKLQIIMNTI